jgi:glycerol-3-phosphate acyltransferase PlsY
MKYFLSGLIAYIIGAIPFSLILGKIFANTDIREKGSKNIGATNLARVCGLKIGVWGYILDILKGILPALILPYLLKTDNIALLEIIIVTSLIIGHMFPVYLKLKGGKGVAVALGSLLVVQTFPALSSLFIFILILLLTRYISLGSIVATIFFPIFIIIKDLLFHNDLEIEFIIFGVILAIAVIIAHHSNISRLLNGTENKI